MGRVIVRFNHVPDVLDDLKHETERAVALEARELANDIARQVWFLYGYVQQATVPKTMYADPLHAEVWCGFNRDKGFYSRFNEHGTIYQRPRPVVAPNAHRHEQIFAGRMRDAVRRACRAR